MKKKGRYYHATYLYNDVLGYYLFIGNPCNPDPCNQNGNSGETCAAGICNCGAAACTPNEVCNAGVCGKYLKSCNPNNIINTEFFHK